MQTVIEASPRKKAVCPFCHATMKFVGDGRYVCPAGCGEYLRKEQDEERPQKPPQARMALPWPELVEGMPAHMRQVGIDIATLPLRTPEPGPCQGHGGKGGGGGGGRAKGPARQKADAWVRKTAPGRFVRSARLG